MKRPAGSTLGVRPAGSRPKEVQSTLGVGVLADGSEVESADAEDPDQSDNNQVDGDDEVEQARHGENQNPGDQGYQWSKGQIDVHDGFFSLIEVSGEQGLAYSDAQRRLIVLSPDEPTVTWRFSALPATVATT